MRSNVIVLPFPPARRRAFVRRHAAHIAALSHEAGVRHLSRQLRIQEASLLRKQVSRARVDAELRRLADAIRFEVQCLATVRGGVA